MYVSKKKKTYLNLVKKLHFKKMVLLTIVPGTLLSITFKETFIQKIKHYNF
jgi:hypothetical protein